MRFSTSSTLAFPFVAFVAFVASCDGSSSLGSQNSALTCQAPAGISTGADAAAPGCVADPSFKICGPSTCQSACSASEVAVTCTGASQFGPIPAPDAALGCTVLPVPTPSDVLFYCCPCAQ
jgi:hypothetical protein